MPRPPIALPQGPEGPAVMPPFRRPRIRKLPTLGHDVIDSEHSAIAEQWYRTVNCEPLQFPLLIARLKKLMASHFDHEAALMERAGGHLCGCHLREHQTLLDLCDRAHELSSRSWHKAQSLLRTKFPRLIRDHVMYMDQIAVLFINTNEAARPVTILPVARN